MITFEEMPISAQKSYNLTNKIRKIAMFIGFVITALALVDINVNHGISFINLFVAPVFAGGLIPGIVHGGYYYKKVFLGMLKFPIIFYIGIVFGVVVAGLILVAFAYGGFIFLIIDTIRFIQKKPLIYSFEHKHFLESNKAQEEMQAAAYNNYLDAVNSDNVMNKMQDLKQMLDQGVITSEEFEIKKAELLDRM